MKVKSENLAAYNVQNSDGEIISKALQILLNRMRKSEHVIDSPESVKNYLTLKLAELPHEVFGCVYLDARNAVIDCNELFRGTLTQTSVYPREVVKEVLRLNAAAVILYHNHPSGNPNPSRADELLTRTLKGALELVDCKVLDHIIVAKDKTLSFAERGLI